MTHPHRRNTNSNTFGGGNGKSNDVVAVVVQDEVSGESSKSGLSMFGDELCTSRHMDSREKGDEECRSTLEGTFEMAR